MEEWNMVSKYVKQGIPGCIKSVSTYFVYLCKEWFRQLTIFMSKSIKDPKSSLRYTLAWFNYRSLYGVSDMIVSMTSPDKTIYVHHARYT